MAITTLLEFWLTPSAVSDSSATRQLIHSTLQVTGAFPGCLGVEVLVDIDDPSHIFVRESWASTEHDDTYRAWRRTEAGASQMPSILASPPRLIHLSAMTGD